MAEKSIWEIREQIFKISTHDGQVDVTVLARAIFHLNDVIRHSGFSAKELLYSREKITGENIFYFELPNFRKPEALY